jgi:hypothetical protein
VTAVWAWRSDSAPRPDLLLPCAADLGPPAPGLARGRQALVAEDIHDRTFPPTIGVAGAYGAGLKCRTINATSGLVRSASLSTIQSVAARSSSRGTFPIRSWFFYTAGRIDAAIAISSALGIESVSVLETQ